jgi:hypothetical protein
MTVGSAWAKRLSREHALAPAENRSRSPLGDGEPAFRAVMTQRRIDLDPLSLLNRLAAATAPVDHGIPSYGVRPTGDE